MWFINKISSLKYYKFFEIVAIVRIYSSYWRKLIYLPITHYDGRRIGNRETFGKDNRIVITLRLYINLLLLGYLKTYCMKSLGDWRIWKLYICNYYSFVLIPWLKWMLMKSNSYETSESLLLSRKPLPVHYSYNVSTWNVVIATRKSGKLLSTSG